MTADLTQTEAEPLRDRIEGLLTRARQRTQGLTGCLTDDDLIRQHSPLMSPLVWDLAHVANQEELWLLREVAGRDPMHPEIDSLYDAFEHPRAERPTLPLMRPAEARSYAHEVRGRVLDVLERVQFRGARLLRDGFAFGMIAQHEQQHDETMLATHQLRVGAPALSAPPPALAPADVLTLPAEVLVPGGPFTMGTSTEPWALDNERPAHVVDLPPFWIDTAPVTNAAWLEFIAAGGYDRPEYWTEAGWAHRQRAGLTAPQFWRREAGQWLRTRFGVTEPVPPAEPVVHVCWYEADAYARWAGRRLPREAEWEKAARYDPATGRSRRFPWGDGEPTQDRANLGQRHLQPAPAGSYPAGAAPSGARQLIGDVWEWTSSDFLPYPGFTAWPYKEYSEVFFGPDYKVLRGGAFSVDPVVCRSTFRNWDYPIRRQIFSGLRTARDASAGEAT
jgi:iron(II)-dependent oxidoreductase